MINNEKNKIPLATEITKAQKNKINENLAVFSQLDKIIENNELISSEKYDNKNKKDYSVCIKSKY